MLINIAWSAFSNFLFILKSCISYTPLKPLSLSHCDNWDYAPGFDKDDISDWKQKHQFIYPRVAYGPVTVLPAWDVRDESWDLPLQLIYIRTIPVKSILLDRLCRMTMAPQSCC